MSTPPPEDPSPTDDSASSPGSNRSQPARDAAKLGELVNWVRQGGDDPREDSWSLPLNDTAPGNDDLGHEHSRHEQRGENEATDGQPGSLNADTHSGSATDTQRTEENIATIDEMVVYLDGQLESEERQQLERRLLEDETARQHLAELQKSWDALDALPRASCNHSFTESTVKLVVRDAIQTQARTASWRLPLLWMAGSVAIVLFLGVGFVSARQWMTQEDRALLQQMDLIENWEKYESVGDFELLERLQEEGFFSQELPGESE